MFKKYWPVMITSLYVFLSLLFIHQQRLSLIREEAKNEKLEARVKYLEESNIASMKFISGQIIARLDSLKAFHK